MNNITPSSAQHQRGSLAHYASSCNSYSYFNLLTSDTLLNEVESQLPDHRERRYPPTETLSMLLAQAMSSDRPCQNIVNQAAVDRMLGGLPKISARTGGDCRARKRLPTPMVSKFGRLNDASSPVKGRWHGRRVYLVDGTSVTMADTPENQSSFPQQRAKIPGLGFPVCRVVGITSLATGALQCVDILMEQQGARKRVTDFRKGTKLGTRDHLSTLPKPKIKPH